MRPVEIEVKIGLARREMEYWQGILRGRRCESCGHYSRGWCAKFDAAPPAEVIKAGCEEWAWDCIPF